MAQKNNSTPSKTQQQIAFHNNLVTSMGTLQPTTPLTNIAPAPPHAGASPIIQQAGAQAQQMQHPMPPPTPQQQGQPQVITSMGQPLQQQLTGQPQYQVIPQPYGASPSGAAQFTFQPVASINQHGQLVYQQGTFALPSGMQLAPQPGQHQQYVITASPSQKPGQPAQMISAQSPIPNQQGKATSQGMTGLAQAPGSSGGVQYMIATNTMAGMAPGAPPTPGTPIGSQVKQGDQKPLQGIPTSMTQQAPQNLQPVTSTAQAPQQIIVPQGMYMPQQGQAFISNGQLIFRAPGPQDPTQQLMFSPTGPSLVPTSQMQAMPPQLTTSIAQAMPTLTATSTGMLRPPSNVTPTMPTQGKPIVPRSLQPMIRSKPAFPTTTTTPTTPNMGDTRGQPSPKSKTPKISPRGSTGQVGRPPGPAKSALNALKGPSGNMPPPRLPQSPVQAGVPQLPGPPLLHTSQINLLPNANLGQVSTNLIYGQPPKLLPMTTVANNSTTNTTSSPTKSKPGSAEKRPASTDANGDVNGSTPKAVVKPNVLTHVIDGHVIMESSEPFPVDREDKGSSLRDRRKSDQDKTGSNTSTPNNKSGQETKRRPGRPKGSTAQSLEQQKLLQKSGKIDATGPPANKMIKMEEAKAQQAKPSSQSSESESHAPKTSSIQLPPGLSRNPLKWNVTQVCDFIRTLTGCSDYIEDFQLQEIDGQALMLLKAEHLQSAMQIKLGPALKICNAVDELREELKQN